MRKSRSNELAGKYSLTIDIKGRVNIPFNISEMIEDNLIFLRDAKKYIDIIPSKHYKESLRPKHSKLSIDSKKREGFFGSIYEIKLDNQNRITIPKEVRKGKTIEHKTKISLIGIGNAIRLRF